MLFSGYRCFAVLIPVELRSAECMILHYARGIHWATIEVGRTGFDPGPPPLRTVRAGLPHTALRLVGHPGGG